jgi:lysophospholipase L1-like esterase
VDYYGLAGVAVETDRRWAWGKVTAPASGRFDLHYLKQPGGGDFDVLIDGRRQERISTRAAEKRGAYATYEVEDGEHTFEVRVQGGGPVRLFGVAIERDRPGVVVDTLGINGARARYQLMWDDALYREQLARRRPSLVVLAYGTNEAGDDDVPIEDYEARVRQVVTRLREVTPEASCLLIGPSDRPIRDDRTGAVEDRPRTAQLVEVQRRVAEELGCGFFDLVQFMGGPLGMVDWVTHDPPYGAPDHIHFTRAGYERLGDVLFTALTWGYGELPEPLGDGDAPPPAPPPSEVVAEASPAPPVAPPAEP